MASTLFLIVILGCASIFNAQYLSSSVTRDGYQMWAPSLNSATQRVMEQLNTGLALDQSLQLSKVNLEGTKISQGVMYTVGVEVDIDTIKNARYEFSFLQSSETWHPLWGALPLPEGQAPSTTPLSTALSLANEHYHYTPQAPELSMTLRGPLEVYLSDRAVELHIKTPREVDVGYVNKIVLANGVNMTVSGFSEMYLRDPLTVSALPTISNSKLLVDVEDTPKLTFVGRHVEISNATTTEVLKVKKRGLSEIEVLSATDTPVQSHRLPFEIPVNDSRLQTLQQAMQQIADSVKASRPPVLRRLLSTKLEAVTTFFIPLEVVANTGETTDWEVIIAQGASTKMEPYIVSLEKKKIITVVTYDQELAANGTLADALQDFLAGRPDYKIL